MASSAQNSDTWTDPLTGAEFRDLTDREHAIIHALNSAITERDEADQPAGETRVSADDAVARREAGDLRRRVRARLSLIESGGYSVAEMAYDLERLANHPMWLQAEDRAVADEAAGVQSTTETRSGLPPVERRCDRCGQEHNPFGRESQCRRLVSIHGGACGGTVMATYRAVSPSTTETARGDSSVLIDEVLPANAPMSTERTEAAVSPNGSAATWGILQDLCGAVNALDGGGLLADDATAEQRIAQAMIYLRPALREAQLAADIAERDARRAEPED